MLHNGFYDVFSPMETPRLRIRKLGIGDAEDVFAFSRNPEVSRYVLWDTHRSIADSRSMVRSALRAYRTGEAASLAIELRETRRVIGTIGFVWIDDEHNCGEIGYSLAQEYWGQGLMTEALRAMLRFAFTTLHLNRVEAMYDVRNRASGRVMEKCGLRREGLLREKLYNKGEYVDVEIWAILARDWHG
ncbi:MAG: GNAT family N-acetyltransferase [Candidatus Spyradocola sp.]|jgi:ribosomal-protein-alanine N-acetyltransferase